MIESVKVRQRGSVDFETHYDNLCAMQDTCPLPLVKVHLSQGVLDINGDRIRVADWPPILNTLRINRSLEMVAFRSFYQPPGDSATGKKALIEKRKAPAIRSKEITYRLCKSLKECASATPALNTLEIQGLPLRERDLQTLMKGIVKNTTLTHLSLEYCRIGDTGLEIICKGIKNSPRISSVNFTGCSLTFKGAEVLSKVIRHQAMKRHNEAWRDSLRYRQPDLDQMQGIRRITINNNPMLTDQGAVLLAEALKDDLWLKALDLQGCGISTEGAQHLLDVLKYNTTIVVLDVRRNPLIDRNVVHSIMEQLLINSNGQDTEYKWIKAEEPSDAPKSQVGKPRRRTRTLNSSFGRKTTIRVTAGSGRRRTRSAGAMGVTRRLQPFSSEGVKAGPGLPWRTAARANRHRGYPPDQSFNKSCIYETDITSPDQTASLLITKDDDLASVEEPETQLHRLNIDDSMEALLKKSNRDVRIELIQLRRQLQGERIAFRRSEQKIVELTVENKRLREENSTLRRGGGAGILDDDSVLESIESSFKQFHNFLDMLRDAGLGQLISMAGLDKQGTPFSQSYPLSREISSRNHKYAGVPISQKPNAFENSSFMSHVKEPYGGDISSSNQISAPFNSFEERQPIQYGPDTSDQYFNNVQDPTMSAADKTVDQDYEKLSKPSDRNTDELYHKIMRDIGGLRMQPSDVVLEQIEAELSKPREKTGQDFPGKSQPSKSSSFDKDKKSTKSTDDEETDGNKKWLKKGTSGDEDEMGRISEKIDPSQDRGSPRPQSKASDYNYSMDSFVDQSIFSEREELIHLDDGLSQLDGSMTNIPGSDDE